MFTGIVSDIGTVAAVADHHGPLRRLRIHCAYDPDGIAVGASIACSGPCLTVVAKGPSASGLAAGGLAAGATAASMASGTGRGGAWFEVDVGAETLARTSLGGWTVGTRVNLERSLKLGDELGGHMVSGHVDGLAELIERQAITGAEAAGDAGEWGPTARLVLRAPRQLARFIAEKGSVALDGTSLTVNSVDGEVFSVLLIPHTLAVTTWGERQAGDRLNLEIDLIARYAARLAEARAAGY